MDVPCSNRSVGDGLLLAFVGGSAGATGGISYL